MQGKRLPRDPRRAFYELHGFEPARPRAVRLRMPRGALVHLYDVTDVVGVKPLDEGLGAQPTRFHHAYAPGHGPIMAADRDGWTFLVGGRYEVSTHGIEDTPRQYAASGARPEPIAAMQSAAAIARGNPHAGVQERTMRHYSMRTPSGRFVRAPYYGPSYGRSNPDVGPVLRIGLMVGGGILLGLAVNAAVQAMPARVSDTIKDAISLALVAAAAFVPQSTTGRVIGIAAAVALSGALVNRRFDVTGKVVAWVQTKFAALYARVPFLNAPAPTTPALTPGATPPTSGWSSAADRNGLPNVGWPTVQY